MYFRNFALTGLLLASTSLFATETSVKPLKNMQLTYENPFHFKGQGLIADGYGGFDLRTERCGVENGSDAEVPYLLWVLTATKANNADIKGPWETAPMTKISNGT